MALTFPRELPEDIPLRVKRFEIMRSVAASRSGNRVSGRSEVHEPFWEVELETKALLYGERMKMEAWLQSMRGGLHRALYWHKLSCFPLAHPGDGGVAVTAGTLSSVASGNVLSVSGVNSGLVLTVGDLIGIEATHRALGMITEVSGSGTSRTITIEPEPPVDVAVVSATVRFVKPTLIMRLVPNSIAVAELKPNQWVIGFTLQESR